MERGCTLIPVRLCIFHLAGYTALEPVEILSNLAWGLAVVVLWGFWLHGLSRHDARGSRRNPSLLPAIGVQLVALAMLSAVLLPVISVTDDLQSANFPAEVERTGGRNDRHLSLDQLTHPLPVALALLTFYFPPLRLHSVAFLGNDELLPRQHHAYARTLWSRPPPAA